jgi:hypothetical protein
MRALALAFMMPILSNAAECAPVRSGPQTNALVELYTSEGCSSCPPADRWLSSLKSEPRTVALAFHVSYWDYIGWKDRFADERFTRRQREAARAAGARSVYTPQVLLAGRDYLRWRSDAAARQDIGALQRAPAAAQIEIAARAGASGRIEGDVASKIPAGAKRGELELFVAVTQSGLASRVTAGENSGEHLRHDFVVRDLLVAKGDLASPPKASFAFAPRADWNVADMAVVAFVQNVATGEVLQALSAPVCR